MPVFSKIFSHSVFVSRVVFSSALLIILGGCVTSAVMLNPKTGEVQQCRNNGIGLTPIIDQAGIDKCAEAYMRMGWVKQ
jgi:hypothetical protein